MDKIYNKYTNRDISSIRKSAIDSVKNSQSGWNDFNESDLGMVLIETASGIADINNFYLDNQALESNLMTARQPKNIKGIIESYNIKLKTLGSALGYVDLYTTKSIHAVIPAYTQLSSSNGIYYITTESKILNPDMEVLTDIPIMQGSRYIEHISSELLNKKTYKYYLQIPEGVPIDSVQLYQDNQEWEKVEDAFLEVNGGPKYSVHEDNKGHVYLMFTFNWKDYLPTDNNETVKIYYVKSIGTQGVVAPLAITNISDTIYDVNNEPINDFISISNANSTYGSYDKINYSKLKSVARNSILSMGRCITLSDYAAKIALEPYILDSYTCDWRSDPSRVKKPYQVKSWILTTDSLNSDISTLPRLEKLENEIMDIGDVAVQVLIRYAQPNPIEISIDLVTRGQPQIKSDIRDRVSKFINDKYSLYNLKLGDILNTTDLKRDILSISPSIMKVEMEVKGNTKCEDTEFFKLEKCIVSQLDSDRIDYGLLSKGVDDE